MRRSYHHTNFAYEDTKVQSHKLHTTHLDLETFSFFVSGTLMPLSLWTALASGDAAGNKQ